MGTRTFIILKGKDNRCSWFRHQTVLLYRHYDGNPETVLESITQALQISNDQCCKAKKSEVIIEQVIGNLIGCTTSEHGMAIGSIKEFDNGEEFNPSFLKFAKEKTDLEWIYVLDLLNKSIEIYYGGDIPEKAIKAGFADLEKIKKRYNVNNSIQKLESFGFSINKRLCQCCGKVFNRALVVNICDECEKLLENNSGYNPEKGTARQVKDMEYIDARNDKDFIERYPKTFALKHRSKYFIEKNL